MTSEKTILKRLEFENKDFRQPKVKTESPKPVNGSFYSKIARATVFYPANLPDSEKEIFEGKWEEKYRKNRELY